MHLKYNINTMLCMRHFQSSELGIPWPACELENTEYTLSTAYMGINQKTIWPQHNLHKMLSLHWSKS